MSSSGVTVPLPDDVAAYLRIKGWEVESSGSVAALWRRKGGEPLLVPHLPNAPDYSKRVHLLTSELARVERRDASRVEEDMTRVYCDISNVTAKHPFLETDSIPLESGVGLYLATKRMVIAAAGATLRRQGHFGHSLPRRAREHAHNVRLGHSRQGSYTVPIISLAKVVAPQVRDRLDIEAEESLFDRRVMITFARALGALQELSAKGPAVAGSQVA